MGIELPSIWLIRIDFPSIKSMGFPSPWALYIFNSYVFGVVAVNNGQEAPPYTAYRQPPSLDKTIFYKFSKLQLIKNNLFGDLSSQLSNFSFGLNGFTQNEWTSDPNQVCSTSQSDSSIEISDYFDSGELFDSVRKIFH